MVNTTKTPEKIIALIEPITVTEIMDRPLYESVKLLRKELEQIAVLINMMHVVLTKGEKYGFAAEIMINSNYYKQVNLFGNTWKFTALEKPPNFDLDIDGTNYKVNKSRMEAAHNKIQN